MLSIAFHTNNNDKSKLATSRLWFVTPPGALCSCCCCCCVQQIRQMLHVTAATCVAQRLFEYISNQFQIIFYNSSTHTGKWTKHLYEFVV